MTPRSELERLWEGRVLDRVELTRGEAAALNATKLVSVEPGLDQWRVSAAYAVGALRVGDLVVRVRPKVGTLQVLRLLARAYGISGLQLDASQVGIAAEDDLTVVLAALFAQEAATALAAGPLRGYRTEDQTLAVLRGRLRFREQELRRFGQLVPLEVTVDEWTTDTDENRLIRAATSALLRLPSVPRDVSERLRRVDRILAGVPVLMRGAPVPTWTPTRLNLSLHRLLHLAEVVMRHFTVEHREGEVHVSGFVVNMAWLFEKFVAQMLDEPVDDIRVHAQKTYPLDEAGTMTIRPDLVMLDGTTPIAVADTKYKILDADGHLPNPDAYQMVTYCGRLGLDVGHLIYAADDAEPYVPVELSILGAGVRIILHRLDLERTILDLEGDLMRVRRAMQHDRGTSPRLRPDFQEVTPGVRLR